MKTSGPGAQGVLRVKGVPARAQGTHQDHSKGSLGEICTEHLWDELEGLSSLDSKCEVNVRGKKVLFKKGRKERRAEDVQGEGKQQPALQTAPKAPVPPSCPQPPHLAQD